MRLNGWGGGVEGHAEGYDSLQVAKNVTDTRGSSRYQARPAPFLEVKMKCELCGQEVELAGKTTKYYVPKEAAKLRAALNNIGILAMSEYAYTKEFTEKTQAIVREALGLKDRF